MIFPNKVLPKSLTSTQMHSNDGGYEFYNAGVINIYNNMKMEVNALTFNCNRNTNYGTINVYDMAMFSAEGDYSDQNVDRRECMPFVNEGTINIKVSSSKNYGSFESPLYIYYSKF